MRNLTIHRRKSFVGCLGRMKVYIEDPTSNDIKIDHIPCRKLGILKNGEEKTFAIEDSAAKVFIIAGKLSKSYCSEYYLLPEGQEDISLAGQNMLNPFVGNAFHFDMNDTPDVIEYRKRNTRRGALALIAGMLVGFIIGFSISYAMIAAMRATDNGKGSQVEQIREKTFSAEGMSVTLTNEFQKLELDDLPQEYTVIYGTEDVAIFALKEEFKLMPGSKYYTLDRYLELVLEANALDSENIMEVEGLTGFVYDNASPDTLMVYRYYSYVYKADDAFWTIQFAIPRDIADQYKEQIIEWARSVTFSNEK